MVLHRGPDATQTQLPLLVVHPEPEPGGPEPHQRVDHRRRISETGAFHNQPGEARDFAFLAPVVQVEQGAADVAADRAAQTPRRHLDELFLAAFDQQMVDELPEEPHDIRLDYILTPTRWYRTDGATVLK